MSKEEMYYTLIDKDNKYISIIKNGEKYYQLVHTDIPELYPTSATIGGIDRYYYNILPLNQMGCKLVKVSLIKQ